MARAFFLFVYLMAAKGAIDLQVAISITPLIYALQELYDCALQQLKYFCSRKIIISTLKEIII